MVKTLTNSSGERPAPLGSLLAAAGRRLSAELDAALRAAGFADVRAAHAPLFLAIDTEGTSVTALAERTRMTKQAVGELIRQLSDRGYLAVGTDEADRRVRRVRLTPRGEEVLSAGLGVVADFDAWLAERIGNERVADLRRTLTMIAETAPDERSDQPIVAPKSRPSR
ncbi:DNA-binding MarR family transcriptional regulator [Naumannella cuiyingiana]|uniref:DNA-binding MarR family transcriptional regulator n=1 Tax=Naumannella cuiyingiana TaxID=1347891 RepID=A0A7Z0D704_9ACTN|nr:MarR family transcriptional regulator [Naumannella cuiyingiana]NYI70058.1 DNA-binding MarR family transcriptional regulator [Naumannella cuiyingiana]